MSAAEGGASVNLDEGADRHRRKQLTFGPITF